MGPTYNVNTKSVLDIHYSTSSKKFGNKLFMKCRPTTGVTRNSKQPLVTEEVSELGQGLKTPTHQTLMTNNNHLIIVNFPGSPGL